MARPIPTLALPEEFTAYCSGLLFNTGGGTDISVLLLIGKLVTGKLLAFLGARLWLMATIAVVFVPLERLIPQHRPQRLFRRLLSLDLLHFLVGGLITAILIVTSLHILQWVTHGRILAWNLRGRPIWLQLVVFEAGTTFLEYWLHRFEHTSAPLWRIHSIHESLEEIDWLAAFRIHPLEPLMFKLLSITPLYFLGLDFPTIIGYGIFSYVVVHIQHSNIKINLGWLEYVITSPRYHRWHHAKLIDENGVKLRSFHNFALYPAWDMLFGTFYLPAGWPTAYGNARGVPQTFLAQMAYPFGFHAFAIRWQARFADMPVLVAARRFTDAHFTPFKERLAGR